ncbi:MAG: hypothetical protein ACLPZY_08060 [Terracidiphilus sp.]
MPGLERTDLRGHLRPANAKFGRRWDLAALCSVATAFLAGCEAYFIGIPTGAVMGRIGVYDYSPSVIQSGTVEQFWWCGQAPNPNQPSQNTDTIQYATIDLVTGIATKPVTVLGETPGAWDSIYVCNAQVVGGSFTNPLGDDQTYAYAMYYVGTALHSGAANSIGVAFSNDGAHWKTYPRPVILTSTQEYYGVAQPAPYNSDRKSGIWLFYEDNNQPNGARHIEATSTDGVHFQTAGTLTTNGMNPNFPSASWGDIAYDPVTNDWYAVFNMNVRAPSTTGNHVERGQLGVTLYRIPAASLLTGATPWEELHSFDTNGTGNESNFIAGFLRDAYGNVNPGSYPAIELFTSISNPKPGWNTSGGDAADSATPEYWDIGEVSWRPNQPLMPLNLYANKSVREATSGWIDPNGGFTLQSTLANLYESPQQGATLAIYGCKNGSTDFFVSTDSACEGQRILGIDGYGYKQPQAGLSLVPLYRCASGHDDFVSTNAECAGEDASPVLLGYALP